MKCRTIAIATLVFFALTPTLYGAEVIVAAAADLNFAIKEIINRFERGTGHKVTLSLGSSGTFHAQIANGAPFDVFLSADITYPRELEKAGLTEPGSLSIYAVGRIVVWVPKSSRIDVSKRGMQSLLDPSVRKIAIANPAHAPYGRAAVSSMQHFGIYESAKGKLVFGENISQAGQFVQSGAAEIGIIALSLARSEAMIAAGKYWEVPVDTYPRMDQGGVILKQARQVGHLDAARAFLAALRSAEGQAVLQRYGFTLPGREESPR